MPDLDDTGLRRSVTSGRSATPHRAIVVRHVCTAVVFVLLYLPLERSTVALQIWSGVSASCPPSALSVALLLGMSLRYAPAAFVAALFPRLDGWFWQLDAF